MRDDEITLRRSLRTKNIRKTLLETEKFYSSYINSRRSLRTKNIRKTPLETENFYSKNICKKNF